MNMKTWLLLIYKVPPTPTANRVYVWRKLKQLGALLWHDAVWILPANDRTREQFQWLAAEIVEMQGEALVWDAQLRLGEQEQKLSEQFTTQVDADYQALLHALSGENADLSAISRQYQQVKRREHLPSVSGEQVRAALLQARTEDKQEHEA